MVLSGTATGSCDCYTLTTATTSQAGSVWSPSTIDLSNPFDFTARVHLGTSDGGADGMAFVLRQSGTTTGTGGGDLGYGGIPNSVAIEIDTWNNGWTGEIASDHLGMNSNGVLTHNLVAATAIPNIEDGIFHDFRVTWDPGTFEMEVFLDGLSIFTYTGDIVTTIFGGSPDVFFGFTAATGGASNLHQVCLDLDADITADAYSVCPGQEIFFTSTSLSGLGYDGSDVTSWLWDFGGGATSALENPSHTYFTIGPKTVTLTITNIIGCTSTFTTTINVDSLEVDITALDVTCFGFDDATATADPTTGDAPYTYLWDDPLAQTTATATGLAPGTYTVLVTDAVGCEQTRSITVTEPPALILDSFTTVNATCGLADGELVLYPSGGTEPYEYSINAGVTFSPDSLFTGLADGDLFIQIKDSNDCIYDDTVTINSDSLDVDMTFTNVTCNGFDNGTGTASPAFGVGPCSYLWDDPLTQITPTATGLAPGTYTVLVTHDAIGCAGYGSVTITEPTELIINEITVVNASCGVANGQISIEATGGTTPYEYSIDGGGSFSAFPTFNDLWPGSYDVVVRDANGCLVSDNVVIINVSNVPNVVIGADFTEGCQPLEVNFTNLSDPLLTDITHWDLGDGTTAEGTTVSNTYEAATCYDIHVTITTFDGCTTEATFEDFICAWKLPVANFDYYPDDPDMLHNEVDFENLSEFASTYEWDFGDGGTSTNFEPSHVYPPLGNLTYQVELIAITDKGCRDTAYKYITIDEVVQYYIPNVFTPNPDPFNQVFTPVFVPGFYPSDFHFIIFNRWGEVVWESYDPGAGWDGTFGDVLVQDGVYIWQLTFRENGSDKKYEDFGHVTLLK